VAQALGGADVVEMAGPHDLQCRSDVRALRAAGRAVGAAQAVELAATASSGVLTNSVIQVAPNMPGMVAIRGDAPMKPG
jgi:hypothetical protein